MARRSRRPSRRHDTLTLVLAVAAAVLISYRAGLALAIAVSAILSAGAGAALWHRCGQRLSPRRAPAGRGQAKTGRAAGTKKARVPAGYLPPKRPQLVPVLVTAQCAGGECGMCPGAGCACSCGHDPQVITARNEARYDRAADADLNGDHPPF